MMRKLLFTTMLLAFAMVGFGQTTYYWVGGAGPMTSLNGTTWSLTPGGTAISRDISSYNDDELVFDNITVAFSISTSEAAKLTLQNGADISFERNSSSGTATLNLRGASGSGLGMTNNSKLRLKDGTGGSFVLSFDATITGTVNNSEVYITGSAGQQRILSQTTGGLVFSSGSKCYTNVSGQYPFSNALTAANKSVIFNSGATLIYQGGRNPNGDTSTGYIVDMKPGSTYVFEANNSTNGFFNSKSFGNVVIKGNSTVALAENFNVIENLTIEAGSTFKLRGSGVSSFTGNILNNGTLGIEGTLGSGQILMIGTVPQSISGTGTFNNLAALTVGADAEVTLGRSINIAGTGISSIIGKLDFGTNSINGVGTDPSTGRLQFRGGVNTSSSLASVVNQSNTVTLASSTAYSDLNPVIGLRVSGPQIPANTYVTSTNSSSQTFTMSNNATGNGTDVTVFSAGPTAKTANLAGIDGSVIINSNGTLSYGSGTNFIFDAATSSPFPLSNSSNLGDVTFNASATTNMDVTVNGKLTLNNAKLTIRNGDNFTMGSAATFNGTFSNTAYVATEANTSTGVTGVLNVSALASTALAVPVGTTLNYAPVTLTPTDNSNFSINVFQGATTDATPNGTAFTAGQKSDAVDAIWNINRTSGTGNTDITLAWNDALEGANFSGVGLGVATYNSGSYGAFSGTASEVTNMASLSTATFGQFLVGKPSVLPVTLINFTAKATNNNVALAWQSTSEVSLSHYIVQRSANGIDFTDLTTVKANNTAGVFNYAFLDKNPSFGSNYYQLVSVDTDGKTQKSELKAVTLGANVASITAYPNPTVNQLNISGLIAGDVIKLFNTSGQLIANQNSANGSVSVLDMSTVKSGLYILSIENSGKVSSSHRIVKQ